MIRKIIFKKTNLKPFICTAIFSLLLSSSFAQKEVDFRLNLEEGMCFEEQTTALSKGTVSTGKEDKENIHEAITVTQYRVVKKTPAFYTLNFMHTDYYVKMTGVNEFTIDPKTADKLNILNGSTQISMIMNKPFFADLSPKGKVLAVKKNKAIEKEFKTKTKKLSPALREQVYLIVNSFTSNESLVGNIEGWTSYIPPSAVKIGDKWSVQKDSAVTEYTFVAETDSTYIIEGVGSMEETKTNEMQGIVMIIHREGEFTVAIEVDKHTFLPKTITQEMEMLGTVEMPSYPAASRPPSRSNATLTWKIRSCN